MSAERFGSDVMAGAGVAGGARRSWFARRWWVVCLALVAVLLAAGGGVAYATYDYSQKYEGRILPRASIAGVDVSGMTLHQARAAVLEKIEPRLDRRITLSYGDRRWVVTPRELGARSNAWSVVAAAFAESRDASFFDKLRMRMLGEELSFDRPVAVTYPRRGARELVEGLAAKLDLEPRDASIDFSSGWVEFTDDRVGRRVRVADARREVMRALEDGRARVTLPVARLEPSVTSAAFDQVLLVRIGENRLYLYENGEIVDSWTVATGQPEYMTPTGLWEVTEKRYMPTWINPAPDTWGADLPPEIPPGPDNPLGLRAINWSAPAIRFHGTSATYSLGYNASHGCVRMSNSDVIELYDRIEVGTPIASVVAGELKPLYVSSPDPTPVPDEGEGKKKDRGAA